jgi:hypothetical protein
MADEQQILEIHKLANDIAQTEYKDYTIGMYDVRCIIKAIEELTHKMYESEKQEVKA